MISYLPLYLRTKLRRENIPLGILLVKNYLYSFIRYFGLQNKKDLIYVIGDSHSLSFTSPRFVVHYLGPVTAYNLGRKNSSTKGNQKLLKSLQKIDACSPVLLVFGEIDCRIHIYYQHKKTGKPIKRLVQETVKNYIKVIKDLKKRINVSVLNIVPPGEQENIYGYPFYASLADRVSITKIFNNELESACAKINVPFVKINHHLEKSGNRSQDFVLDSIHYNNKITKLVEEELEKLLSLI